MKNLIETRIYPATIVTKINLFGKVIELVWTNKNYDNEKQPNKRGELLECNLIK
jgi:hypothetical protein